MIQYLNFSNRKKLPNILQTEGTECGLACLTMIANYYGHDVDLNGMRAKYPVSLRGMFIEDLINLSGQMDLGARALRLDIENLEQLQLPAILHWDLNHFVVLKAVHRKKVVIHDPGRGIRQLSYKEVSDHFTGVALELMPTTTFKIQKLRNKMKLSSLWGRLIGIKRAIVHTFILSVILQIVILASPFYLQLIVDEAIVKFDVKLILVLALGFGALSIINLSLIHISEPTRPY